MDSENPSRIHPAVVASKYIAADIPGVVSGILPGVEGGILPPGKTVGIKPRFLRDRAKINSVIMAQEFCPLARRKRRAYPGSGSVRSEQRSERAKGQARIAEVVLARSLSQNPVGLT
jgi:hypothetical protein